MMAGNDLIADILTRLREFRQQRGIPTQDLERTLILGPGWISAFESGEPVPSLEMLLAVMQSLGMEPSKLFSNLDSSAEEIRPQRYVSALARGNDLHIRFRYTQYDANYILKDATPEEFDSVVLTLRDGLARLVATKSTNTEAIKTDSVARAFLTAVKLWPHANPSDLWWFVIYRAFCDPFNHPAKFARMDLTQSWKRTAGWALEQVLVRHYGPFLLSRGVRLCIVAGNEKRQLLEQLDVPDRLEADKVDVLLCGLEGDRQVCFGVVHVKASFAERRTDDVPLSRSLIRAGYTSPLWTMDCKSVPGKWPTNRGELGKAYDPSNDRRSAKRKDIEDDAFFSACFSYNSNTLPTPQDQDARARIEVVDFTNPDDAFSGFIIAEWERFKAKKARGSGP